ncbi:MAG TPA: hypothetical protein PL033_17810 [Candidatus Brocadiia bacterium]|nr:hypothetical protein [Candidatus Brocadiia bacterium]
MSEIEAPDDPNGPPKPIQGKWKFDILDKTLAVGLIAFLALIITVSLRMVGARTTGAIMETIPETGEPQE